MLSSTKGTPMSDEKIKIYCTNCKGFTNHGALEKVSKTFTPQNHPEMEIQFAEGTWEILECRGCEEITFRETWTTSEDCEIETGETIPTIRLFPPRSERTLPVKSHYMLSPTLRQIYRETIDCYNQAFNILCAVGIRMLIEGICLDKGIKDGPVQQKNGSTIRQENLQGKIEGMVESGIITEEHATTLHELRFLGNEAVHELKVPSFDELQIVIEIVEHTLESLYELTNKVELLHRKKHTRAR